jgi:integrase
MHDLIPLGPALPGSLTTAEIDATMAYAEAEKALATRTAYASDWRDFAAWCASRGATALPAHVGIVAAYLSWLADSGRKASTIGRRAAAIGYRHKIAGHEPPTNAEGVRAVLRGIRRTVGVAPQQKQPVTAERLTRMLDRLPDTLAGKRDRALLALGFAGAFRRSELVALTISDLTEVPDGLRVRIRRSKTDQAGAGQEIAIPRGFRLRPVEAIQSWLEAAGIAEGPLFRRITTRRLAGRGKPATELVGAVALTGHSVAEIVKHRCRRAGLDPAAFSGHSLRSGYVTSAVEVNAPVMKIAEQTRHRSLDMLRVYSRRVDLFREHSGAAFL